MNTNKVINDLDLIPVIDLNNDFLPMVDVTDGKVKKVSLASLGAVIPVSASNITSGTLSDARLSGNVTLKGNTFNTADELVELNSSGHLPALNGSNLTNMTKAQVGLSNVDNTSDLNKPLSSATIAALALKENSIPVGTPFQYWRGDKSFQTLDKAAVGLGNVPNTDATNADNITSGTLSNGRLGPDVVLRTVPIDLGNQEVFNFKSQISSYAAAATVQINNAFHGKTVVAGHASGTINFVIMNSFEPGASAEFWIYTTNAVIFSPDVPCTLYIGNGTTVTSPASFNVPTPARGKMVKLLCISTNTFLLTGDVI